MTFTLSQRRVLLDEAFECMHRLSETRQSRDAEPPGRRPEFASEILKSGDRLRELTRTYIELLPTVQLSRCPFTDAPFFHSWDNFGLDGLWWNFHKSARPLIEKWGGAFHALSGAVRVKLDACEKAPFLAEPGPDVPFLLPRLMEYPGVTAVISQISVGEHMAFPIVYFSQPGLPWKDRANDWGRNHYCYKDDQGAIRMGEHFDAEDEHQYEIQEAIAANRLRWIAPDDPLMRIQTGLANCPFVGLPGIRSVARIQNGKLWRPD
jgi:hypothetical protein